VFVNGKQVCSTKINSCTVKRQLLPNDSIRVVSSDGATSPSKHFFDKFSFTGELNFVPNSAKPAANFEVQLKRLVAQLKAGGFKKVVVTGHANLLGSKPTANSSRLATARGAVVAKRLKAMLPGVEILVVNRSVFSPLVAANSTKNIRAEVYAVK
jgi:outer membrane protein OmpA-like peptidoglycan-associated protein